MLTPAEKQALKQQIQANKHEVFVISFEEMDAIIRSSPQGKKKTVTEAWNEIKGQAEIGANYYASAKDATTLSKLIGDLGSVGAKAYIKTYGGKPHIILKGYPGLRKVLTGTKYGITNPKVVTMGLGKAGAVNAAKSGGIISIVLLTTYRVVDYFLTDQATLSQLVGTLATDVVKVGIATGASIAMATTFAAATFAIGPLLVVIVFSIVIAASLDYLDNKYSITEKLIAVLDEVGDDALAYIREHKLAIKNSTQHIANEALGSAIDYAVETAQRIVIDFARHTLDRFLNPRPRL